MKTKILFLFIILTTVCSCDKRNVRQWNDSEIDQWFKKSEWLTVFSRKPDVSINKRLFVEQNVLNPKAWKAAMKFIKESNFDTMEVKKYKLLDDGTYAILQEYMSKDSSHFEVHRKYIDLQIVSKGKEYIYISPYEPDKQSLVTAYNKERDIEFFDKKNYTRNLLTPENFIVLFPLLDGHMPGMKVGNSELVRKVIIKIPYIE